jgi:hypothetical protein
MTSHPSPCKHQSVWRAAIAINNIGWTLLERACYDQAHQTLTDAALAMVALIYDSERETHLSVEAGLRAANKRLAFPQHSSLISPLMPLERENFPEPIRLDVDEFVEIDASLEFVAIAVHNAAVSNFYKAITDAQTSDAQGTLSSMSVSLLELSYSIIAEVGGYAPTTFTHALRILENLQKVMRWTAPSGIAPAVHERPGIAEIRAWAAEEWDAELTRVRKLVESLDHASRAVLGRSFYAAAA